MKLPVAKIEDITEPDHDALSNVYFDKEHNELIAADGFSMVVIPVDSKDEDISGCVSTEVIEFARKYGVDVRLYATRAEAQTSEGMLWQKRHEGYPESVRRIISDVLVGEDDCTVISLDVGRLIHLAEALLDRSHDCRITLKIHGEEEPVLVRPYYDKVWDSRFGIIMPLANRGRK